jgi:hypothetical protein
MAASKSGSAIHQQSEHPMPAGVWGVRVQALLLGRQSLKSQPPHTTSGARVPEIDRGK